MKKCQAPSCTYNVFSNHFCKFHQNLRKDDKWLNKPEKKDRKPIKKVSDKLGKELKIYSLKRLIYLKEHPCCQVQVKGCEGKATTVHHKKGRGKYLNDTDTWLGCCMPCHRILEEYPTFAKDSGFSVNRLSV